MWKGLKEDVLQLVQECESCQRNKGELTHPAGLLQPLPILEGKCESILMDFITKLPIVQGKDCIYLVVDRLTKFSHFFAIPTRDTIAQVVELFFRQIFKLHGLHKNIVSHKASRFMGGFWQELFRLVGTELTPSTSYHPQTNGQMERVNQWLEGYLRNYVTGQQKTWIQWLHLGEPQRPKARSKTAKISSRLSRVTAAVDLHPLDDEGHLALEPEAILESKERRLRSRTIREFLVRWKNLLDEDATREGEHILEHPALRLLEGKQHLGGEDCHVPSQRH
eukprot:PITA_14753